MSYNKGKNWKKNLKKKGSESKKVKYQNYKQISFSELDKISHLNIGRFNRNVYTEKVVEDFPQIEDKILIIQVIMEHNHFMCVPTEKHYRTIVYNHYDVENKWIQDISIEQWDNLKEIPIEFIEKVVGNRDLEIIKN